MSKALLLFMTDVSTLYYSDASDVGTASAYLQSSTNGILGKRMNISWETSESMFGGMCHAESSDLYFATLYAVVERFRVGSTTFRFVNFEGYNDQKTHFVEEPESQVYPVHTAQPISAGKRVITLESAFGPDVARMATDILGRPLSERKFKFGGMSTNIPSACTRVVLEHENSAVLGFEFDQGGVCNTIDESERVPIMGGGQNIANSRIIGSTCVDCAAGIFVAAGGDVALNTEVTAANMYVQGMEISDTVYLWSDRSGVAAVSDTVTICPEDMMLSQCQNASFPGTEESFARIVGDPIVPACPSAAVDEDNTTLSPFCDVFFKYSGTKIVAGQLVGGPIASTVRGSSPVLTANPTDGEVGQKLCTAECTTDMYTDYNTLFGDKLDECCDGIFYQSPYTCTTDQGFSTPGQEQGTPTYARPTIVFGTLSPIKRKTTRPGLIRQIWFGLARLLSTKFCVRCFTRTARWEHATQEKTKTLPPNRHAANVLAITRSITTVWIIPLRITIQASLSN